MTYYILGAYLCMSGALRRSFGCVYDCLDEGTMEVFAELAVTWLYPSILGRVYMAIELFLYEGSILESWKDLALEIFVGQGMLPDTPLDDAKIPWAVLLNQGIITGYIRVTWGNFSQWH